MLIKDLQRPSISALALDEATELVISICLLREAVCNALTMQFGIIRDTMTANLIVVRH